VSQTRYADAKHPSQAAWNGWLERDDVLVQAAHLIPFSTSRNDNPTNGIALCPNHHWAMDRRLIAPCPDDRKPAGIWRVNSERLDERIEGQRDLVALAGHSVPLGGLGDAPVRWSKAPEEGWRSKTHREVWGASAASVSAAFLIWHFSLIINHFETFLQCRIRNVQCSMPNELTGSVVASNVSSITNFAR
jgi:hypothetical protein